MGQWEPLQAGSVFVGVSPSLFEHSLKSGAGRGWGSRWTLSAQFWGQARLCRVESWARSLSAIALGPVRPCPARRGEFQRQTHREEMPLSATFLEPGH